MEKISNPCFSACADFHVLPCCQQVVLNHYFDLLWQNKCLWITVCTVRMVTCELLVSIKSGSWPVKCSCPSCLNTDPKTVTVSVVTTLTYELLLSLLSEHWLVNCVSVVRMLTCELFLSLLSEHWPVNCYCPCCQNADLWSVTFLVVRMLTSELLLSLLPECWP